MATGIDSRVSQLRRSRGFSQRRLAEIAAITRQAVGAIESGRMQPSVGIALRLARALGTSVEEVFGSEVAPAPLHERTATATIGGRTVTHALDEDHLLIEPAASSLPTVFIAGCDLSVGLLSRHATARSRDMRVLWLTMTNRAALSALDGGKVHAAIVHAGASAGRSMTANVVRFEVATTEAGWLFERGNGLRLRGASDLIRKKVRLANRPVGAGARRLLDEQLRRADVDPARVAGYTRELPGQLDAGRAIAQGFADAAIGTAGTAHVFGSAFVPLERERCTLLVRATALQTPEIRTLLDALRSAPYRRDLEALQSYDVAQTGERIG